MTAVLTLTRDGETREFVCKAVVTIGRDKNSDIVILDRLVSRRHAIIRLLGDEDFYLVDEGSANGSMVNARKVILPTLLSDGDKITIGSATISFRQQRDSEAGDDDQESADTVLMAPSIEVSQHTILVADIRGFTRMSESIPIKALTEIMNKWFHAANDCIAANGGLVDKFLGDCVYARWPVVDDVRASINAAIRAACQLNDQTRAIGRDYRKLPHVLKIGAGIHTGMAATGVERGDSAIGDAVNLAFRLEGATKELGKDVVISIDVYKCLAKELWQDRTMEISVKGKAEPVEVLALDFSELDGLCS